MQMLSHNLVICIIVLFLLPPPSAAVDEFVFNGFRGSNLVLDGSASVMQHGLLSLITNMSCTEGSAFYPHPFQMRNSSDGSVFSFSATFIFAMTQQKPWYGDGIAFVLAPRTNFIDTCDLKMFGLLTEDENGKSSNHLLAIELDTSQNPELEDIDDNHVGIDINSLDSSKSSPAGYYKDEPFSNLHTVRLTNGNATQVWIDYDHRLMQLNVTLAPVPMLKPNHPLLSSIVNLSSVFLDHMYVGFSSSTSSRYFSYGQHFIIGCSFKINGRAESLDYSKLPSTDVSGEPLPIADSVTNNNRLFRSHGNMGTPIVYAIGAVIGMMSLAFVISLIIEKCCTYWELREDWEIEFGPHRLSYKDLFNATNGFKEKQLLGAGGFGKVYKGVLSKSKLEVAVKVMSHDSNQGMRQFIAEVVSMGRLRHRNLVQLLGYCRRKGELLLVYEYMPNGSLDRYLYGQEKPALNWAHRFEIIKGVASGLLYLHEEWGQVVIHRDVKASNILLDTEMNARLSDFGLARLHDHGAEAHTTHVAGTRGYISPELARLGKATKATDVFAFGVFIMEVACGRRPIGVNAHGELQLLVDFVLSCWQRDSMMDMIDPRLGGEYVMEEADLVLKLGLLCSHPSPMVRPTMRLVMQYLSGDAPFPDIPATYMSIQSIAEMQAEDHGEDVILYPSVQATVSSLSSWGR